MLPAQLSAREKAELAILELKKHFDKKNIRISSFEVLESVEKFTNSHARAIRSQVPLSKIWRVHYNHLHRIKIFLNNK